jgi:hypothetical protein
MVSSRDLPSDFNLASFSSGPIFEFFNTIRRNRTLPLRAMGELRPKRTITVDMCRLGH